MFYATLSAPGQKHPDYEDKIQSVRVEGIAVYIRGLRYDNIGSLSDKDIDSIVKWGNETTDTAWQDNEWELYEQSDDTEGTKHYTGWVLTVEGKKEDVPQYAVDTYAAAIRDITRSLKQAHFFHEKLNGAEYQVLKSVDLSLVENDAYLERSFKNDIG